MADENSSTSSRIGALVWLAALAGCGGGSVSYAPVSGMVTVDGKPVANAQVHFDPDEETENLASGSMAMTDEDGRFELETAHRDVGAVPGSHTVRIVLPPELPPLSLDNQKFVVPEDGTDEANFNLSSK